jgi:hypothetical protein
MEPTNQAAATILYSPSSCTDPLAPTQVASPQNSRITQAVSAVFDQIKEWVSLIGKWISSNFENRIESNFKAEIEVLPSQSKFIFTIESPNLRPEDKTALEAAFHKASISETPISIFVDQNGKLCKERKSAVEFICSKEGCEVKGGRIQSGLTHNGIEIAKNSELRAIEQFVGTDFLIKKADETEVLNIKIKTH